MQARELDRRMKILPNGVAVIESDTHHALWCEQAGLIHDRWMAQHCRDAITRRQRKVGPRVYAIDGGANIGTLTAAMIDAKARVLAFEPNPDAIECLRVNCPEAEIVQAGLGRESAIFTLHRQENAGASFLEQKNGRNGDLIEVEVKALDSYFSSSTPVGEIALIKLDIEGFEVQALQGAEEIIRCHQPTIIAEINRAALERAGSSPAELFDFLKSLGYRWRILQPECNVTDLQFDIIAIHR